ncbi:MAG: hypothetical protein ACTSRK_07465 [Promethearchaeota archaeon]
MRSIRYLIQNKQELKGQILNLFILSTSIAMVLVGILMISYCAIFLVPSITAIPPYLLYGFLITMGIFGIRFYQLEGSFNVNLNSKNFSPLLSKTAPDIPHKSGDKGFMLFKKPTREIGIFESIKELKIPKINDEDVSTSSDKVQRLSDVEILPMPTTEENILTRDNIYEYLNKTINQTIKEIQELIKFSKIPKSKLLFHKDDAFRSGILLEQNGDIHSAIANYSIAREIAKDLGLDDEFEIFDQSIKNLLNQYSFKEEVRLMKKYHLG